MQRCAVFTVLGSYKVQIDHYHEINTLDNNHQQGYILDTDLARIHWIELYDEGYRPGADYADVFKVVSEDGSVRLDPFSLTCPQVSA